MLGYGKGRVTECSTENTVNCEGLKRISGLLHIIQGSLIECELFGISPTDWNKRFLFDELSEKKNTKVSLASLHLWPCPDQPFLRWPYLQTLRTAVRL